MANINSSFELDEATTSTRQQPIDIRLPRLKITNNVNGLEPAHQEFTYFQNPKAKKGFRLQNDFNQVKPGTEIPYIVGTGVERLHKSHFDNELRSYVQSSQEDNGERKKKTYSKIFRRIMIFFIVALYIAYFIAVLMIQSQIQNDDYWCRGDGFLIIISGLFLFFIIYFKLFKPFIGKPIYKKIIRPLGMKLSPCSNSWFVKLLFYVAFLAVIVAFLIYDTSNDRSRLISIGGILFLLLFGWIFSAAPRKVNWRHIAWGMALQFVLGLLVLRWQTGKSMFQCLGSKVQTYLQFTDAGSGFVFGKLSSEMGIFAFKVLSVIIFFSFCIQILYYYGVMQWIVIKIGWLLQVTIGTTACESVNAAANIFLGQTEAPLIVKPYLPKMTKSEIHAVMTGGFATIAGTVLAAYISFGIDPVHLLSASVMSAPAALAYAKLFYPEVEVSQTKASDIKVVKGKEANVLHAAIEGVANAIPLIANIAANIIAIIAFVALIDAILNWSCQLVNVNDGVCSLSSVFGYVLMPLAWIMGVPWVDCYNVGQLLGTKTVINEFVAYIKLAEFKNNNILTKKSEIIATYALCGFSNFSSIGTMLGGLGPMAPERRGDMASVVFRAMIAGTAACFLTACVAGVLIEAPMVLLSFNTTNSTIEASVVSLSFNATSYNSSSSTK